MHLTGSRCELFENHIIAHNLKRHGYKYTENASLIDHLYTGKIKYRQVKLWGAMYKFHAFGSTTQFLKYRARIKRFLCSEACPSLVEELYSIEDLVMKVSQVSNSPKNN